MKYLKIFTDFLDVVEPLTDDERGRLFMAMLSYALDGSQPDLIGNERFVWAVAKQHINREVAAYKTKVEAGREAGRKSGEARRKQNEPTGIKANQMNQDNDNEKNKNNNNDKNNDNERVCRGAAPPVTPGSAAASRSRSMPPSLEEIEAYCLERGNLVNAQRFLDFYTANGWKIGKTPMKDWKAAVRSWESNGVDQRPAPAKEPSVGDNFKKAMELLRLEEAKQV